MELNNYVGRKIIAFKFDNMPEAIKKYVGGIGIITEVHSLTIRIDFFNPDGTRKNYWFFPYENFEDIIKNYILSIPQLEIHKFFHSLNCMNYGRSQ